MAKSLNLDKFDTNPSFLQQARSTAGNENHERGTNERPRVSSAVD